MTSSPHITRVGLVAKAKIGRAAGVVAELAGWLEARGVRAVFESETAVLAGVPPGRPTFGRDALPRECDLVVVLGGDGTLIGMGARIAETGANVPIVGVNFGSLGFLTEITLPEMYEALESVLDGTARIDERMMLRSQTIRGGKLFANQLALNDIVITKGALSRIIDLAVTIGDQPMMRVRADGLIIASPTGSTAYNLSAGGPVVYPSMNALVITPICPFTLSDRPIVVPDDCLIELRLRTPDEEVVLTLDGQFGLPITTEDRILIRKSLTTFKIVQPMNRNYFEVLREKLRWGK